MQCGNAGHFIGVATKRVLLNSLGLEFWGRFELMPKAKMNGLLRFEAKYQGNCEL